MSVASTCWRTVFWMKASVAGLYTSTSQTQGEPRHNSLTKNATHLLDRACSFIHQQYLGFAQQCPRKAQQLSLTNTAHTHTSSTEVTNAATDTSARRYSSPKVRPRLLDRAVQLARQA